MNPKERIEELVKKLNQANVEYYLHDNPTLTDNEYGGAGDRSRGICEGICPPSRYFRPPL